jgi:hypothetical protein
MVKTDVYCRSIYCKRWLGSDYDRQFLRIGNVEFWVPMRYARATCRCGLPIHWKPCNDDLEMDEAVNLEEIEQEQEINILGDIDDDECLYKSNEN